MVGVTGFHSPPDVPWDSDPLEVRVLLDEAVESFIALGVRLSDAVLESVTLRDPKVAALAELVAQQERLVKRLQRAHMTLVAG